MSNSIKDSLLEVRDAGGLNNLGPAFKGAVMDNFILLAEVIDELQSPKKKAAKKKEEE